MRRSHRSGTAELFLSLVYVFPFRCQYCGHRFRAWRPGRGDLKPERREYERIPTDITVRLSGLPGSARGRAIELSINGCTVAEAATDGGVCHLRIDGDEIVVPDVDSERWWAVRRLRCVVWTTC